MISLFFVPLVTDSGNNSQSSKEAFIPMTINKEEYVSLPLMTISDAAKYMGVGRKIIYQLIEFGELRAVKNKRAVLIEKASVDAFRASGKLT